MGILDILSRIVSILAGVAALTEKGMAYMRSRKARAAKDPSASLPAPDGSIDDCKDNR